MKKMMKIKKIIVIFLIVLMVLNIFPPKFVFSYEDTKKITMEEATIDYETFMKDIEEGASDVGTEGRKPYVVKDTVLTSIVKFFIEVFAIGLPRSIFLIIDIALMQEDIGKIAAGDEYTIEVTRKYGSRFSIQKLVFNKIGLFDINFFDRADCETNLEKTVKDQVTKYYYAMRNIAIAFMLIALIYSGIRMTLSTVASEKATYKKMIVNWFSGFIILMILPYVMIIILEIGDTLIEFLEKIMEGVCGEEVYTLEQTIMNECIYSTEKGFSLIIPAAMFVFLWFYQIKFLWMYTKRLCSTAFLIIISPLVMVQYIIDKAGDDKGDSFNVWMTEFSLNVLIQPLHALLYMVFMTIALNIVQEAPVLAVVFLAALTRGERVLRNILKVKNSETVQSMKDNLSMNEFSSFFGG